jgi:proton-translocating NADH-quinone oxidoreductase chain L
MYLLVLFFPFLNVFLSCGFGRFLGKRYLTVFFLFNMLCSFLLSIFFFYEVGLCKYTCFVDIGNWFSVSSLNINWIFLFDSLSIAMLLLVCFVSFCVHVYSLDYMGSDPHVIRFMGYLSLFTFFMLFLITSGNFVQLFFGWEGVGLSSYLLINFWYTRVQANKSAMKAVIVNRFGDFGIYFFLLIIYFFFRSFDFSVVFSSIPFLLDTSLNFLNIDISVVDFLSFFVFLGAIGKSAQIGLHTWLPDAMEGPTPVSALIHAATMVTAGVFVLIRLSPILEYSDSILFLISLFGGLTAFFAGTVGLVQYDIKKVIAYSTCSQLGYMFFSCGLSNYSVGLFHLFNHGFFKALLFLGAGSVIHALLDEQDMRKMGGLLKILPLTYIAMLIGSLALLGFPFLSGFYSKDVILEVVYSKFSFNSYFIYWLGTISAFITSFYSIRLIYLVFFVKNNSFFKSITRSSESVSYIIPILSILAFLSLFIGFCFKDLFVGLGGDFWGSAIYIAYNHTDILVAEFLPFYIKLTPVIFSLFGGFISFIFYNFYYYLCINLYTNKLFYNIYTFLIKKWYFDLIYNNLFVYNLFYFFYNITFKLIDRGLVEYFGPLSLVRILQKTSFNFSLFQSGLMYNYIFLILAGCIIFIKIIFFSNFQFNWGLVFCFTTLIIFWFSKSLKHENRN